MSEEARPAQSPLVTFNRTRDQQTGQFCVEYEVTDLGKVRIPGREFPNSIQCAGYKLGLQVVKGTISAQAAQREAVTIDSRNDQPRRFAQEALGFVLTQNKINPYA